MRTTCKPPRQGRRCRATPDKVRGASPPDRTMPPRRSAAPARPHTQWGVRAPTPVHRIHRQRAAGAGCTPKGGAVGAARVPKPGRPLRRHQAPPPPPSGALLPPPQAATPSGKSVRCGVGGKPPHPHTPRPRKEGSGPRLHAQRMGGRERESAPTQTPLTEAGGAPPAPGRPPATPAARNTSPRRCCGLTREPSCFSKIPKYDKSLSAQNP